MKTVTLQISDTVYALLQVLTRPEHGPATVEGVIHQLIDHAQQGVYRPGAWERGWLEASFGMDWQKFLQPGDPYGNAGCEHIFQQPKPLDPPTSNP
jgi:hypothetical protein